MWHHSGLEWRRRVSMSGKWSVNMASSLHHAVEREWRVDSDHWLEHVSRCLSPNRNARPVAEPSVLVVHSISLPPGEWGGDAIFDLFSNTLDCARHPSFSSLRGVTVSAHVVIRRNGEAVQCVPFDERAWHAGRSQWKGMQGLNDDAVGIELEGLPTVPFTLAQYRTLAAITRGLLVRYPLLNVERIVGHALIAPMRKEDPGPAFDWQLFRQYLSVN